MVFLWFSMLDDRRLQHVTMLSQNLDPGTASFGSFAHSAAWHVTRKAMDFQYQWRCKQLDKPIVNEGVGWGNLVETEMSFEFSTTNGGFDGC